MQSRNHIGKKAQSCSKYFASVPSNAFRLSLSISKTATTLPSLTTGTTISDRESELQAIWPGN